MAEGYRGEPEGSGLSPEGLPVGETFWSFALVEERLIEAWRFLQRLPDREAGWLRTHVMSLWREVVPDRLERFEEAAPVRLGLRSREVDRMEETLAWLDHTRPVDRRLIGFVLRYLAMDQAHPEWLTIRTQMGWDGTPDALRKRYNRSITRIAHALNAAENRCPRVSRCPV